MRGSGAILLLLKAMFYLYAKLAASAQERNIFSDIVTTDTKKISTPNKHKSECRNSRVNSCYAVVNLIINVPASPL